MTAAQPDGDAHKRALRLGDSARDGGDPEKAWSYYEEALRVAPEDSRQAIEVRLRLGSMAREHDRWDEATDQFAHARRAGEAIGDPLIVASALRNQGIVDMYRSRFATARDKLTQARDLTGQHGLGTVEHAHANRTLGELHLLTGDLNGAEKELRAALRTYRFLGSPEGTPLALRDLGTVAILRHQLVTARRRLQHALALYRQREARLAAYRRGRAYTQLGLASLLAEHNPEEAAGLTRAALRTFRSLRNGAQGEAEAHLQLAAWAPRREARREHARQALAGFAALENRRGEARSLLALAGAVKRPRQMAEFLSRAATLCRESGDDLLLARVCHRQAEVLRPADRSAARGAALSGMEALGRLRGIQSTAAGSSFWQQELDGLPHLALGLTAESGAWRAGLEIIEAVRDGTIAGLFHASHRGAVVDSTTAGILQEIDSLQAALLYVESTAGQSGVDASPVRRHLEHLLTAQIRRLATRTGNFAQRYVPRSVTATKTLAAIPGGSHVLAYHLSTEPDERILYRLWIAPDHRGFLDRVGVPAGIWRDIILPLVAGDAAIIGTPTSWNAPTDWLAELGALLIPNPLAAALTAPAGLPRPPPLVVLPSGALWAIPWAALLVAGRPLVSLATTVLLPSLHALPPAVPDTGAGAFSYFLPGLRCDGGQDRLLREVFPPYQPCFSATELLEALRDGARFRIGVLHAHGNNAPGFAHALVDTHLTPLLSAGQLLGCTVPKHLTLLACGSSRSSHDPGAEPISLATVALVRGAATVMSTVWDIPDSPETVGLANEVHRSLSQRVPAGEALRRAQLAAVTRSPELPLNAWAAHVVIGRPD